MNPALVRYKATINRHGHLFLEETTVGLFKHQARLGYNWLPFQLRPPTFFWFCRELVSAMDVELYVYDLSKVRLVLDVHESDKY